MTEFDYIVVGAGSAGCMVARQLVQRPGISVLLLEAGSLSPVVPRRPAEYIRFFGSSIDWSLATTKQSILSSRTISWPRGRGLGGCTLINAMIWLRPTQNDRQRFKVHCGPTWVDEPLCSNLDAVEQLVVPETPRWISEGTDRFLQAAELASSEIQGQACLYLRMTRSGQRTTAADLLPTDFRKVGFLRMLSASVDSIYWEGDRAAGVQIVCPGGDQRETIRARCGVILAAGAIHSPAILMRSGIGPSELLAESKIPVRAERSDVGNHLVDHLIMPVTWKVPFIARFPSVWSVADLARWQYARSGPISSNLAEAGGFFRTDHGTVQLHVTPTDYLRHPSHRAPPAFTLGITPSTVYSRGRITVTGPSMNAPLRMDPAYLSDQRDMETLISGIEIARQVARRSPLSDWLGSEILPGENRKSPGDVRKAISRYAQTLYHPMGTNRMGTDPCSVVDPEFRVRDTSHLWVCDASVIPFSLDSNPGVTTLALGHRLGTHLASKA